MEFSVFFWRWNFPIAMILLQIIICNPYRRKKYFLLKWALLVGIIFIIAITMIYDWEWSGSQIKAMNIIMNMPARILIMIIVALQMYICYEIKFWNAFIFTRKSRIFIDDFSNDKTLTTWNAIYIFSTVDRFHKYKKPWFKKTDSLSGAAWSK